MANESNFHSLSKINRTSLWVYHVPILCCSNEVESVFGPRFDLDRFGMSLTKDHRRADILLLTGPINAKLVPSLKKIYSEMSTPKWVVGVGVCSFGGGMFAPKNEKYADEIPINVYIPGCPPRPESIINALLSIANEAGKHESA
ncbi:MAG: NADH-quinone oxidoreductase subunit NuoB [Oligoflexia bacterium]|nr:NADH-quinone oxidoreductase subunit NuoB [Oligoflexia bacterium]